MKKLILVCLIISGMAAAFPVSAKLAKHSGGTHGDDVLSSAFSEKNQDDEQNAAGFMLSIKHDKPGRYHNPPGSIRPLQIFPINTVTGGFTYNFS